MITLVKTDTLAISRVLFFVLASATACDFGKGDDDTGPGAGDDGDDAGFDDGVAESSVGGGYDDAGSSATATSGWPGDPSATATSAAESGCDAPAETTDPTFGDTDVWGSSGGGALDTGDGPPETTYQDTSGWGTSGGDDGPITATGESDTGGGTCDLQLAPGNFEYGCLCEDDSCDIYYQGVAQIPDFDDYCNCLCAAKGCGEAVGGVAEGGGGEEG